VPYFDLSGTLANRDARVLRDELNPLTVEATDDDPAGPRSGVQSIQILVDDAERHRKDQDCSTDSCPLSTTWALDRSTLAAGMH